MGSFEGTHLSFVLHRAVLGEYDFRGAARLYYDPRFGNVEHYLLEAHEHNHWSLAQSTVFGTIQLSLAYAYLLAKNGSQRNRYGACLAETTGVSRLVYEGCALFEEESLLRDLGRQVHNDWQSLLADPVYRDSRTLYAGCLEALTFSDTLKRSLAHNLAELCLNSTPVFLERPSWMDPVRVREQLKDINPDRLLEAMSRAIASNAASFAEAFRANALRPAAEECNLQLDPLENDVPATFDARFSAVLSYGTYIHLKDFAKAHGVAVIDLEPPGIDLIRYGTWLEWVRRLPGHEVFYPNLVKDVATFPVRQAPDLDSEDYDFHTFRTAYDPPPTDPRDDITLVDWGPLRRAYSAGGAQRFYLSIDEGDGTGSVPPALASILESTRLTALVGGGAADGSTLFKTMSIEDGKRRFSEETARPQPVNLSIRAGRALLKPRDGYAWQPIGARYRLAVTAGDLALQLKPLADLPCAMAVRWRSVDLSQKTVAGLTFREMAPTVGILVEESSYYGWKRALTRLTAAGFRSRVHVIGSGPRGEFLILVAIADTPQTSPFFVYGVATAALFGKLRSLLKNGGQNTLNSVWLDDLSGEPLEQRFREDAVLICEHYVRRGF